MSDDSFQNALLCLRRALSILTEDPVTQCEMMGNYNVAWELRDDVLSGVYLLEVAENRLSNDQARAIWRIGNALKALDAQILVATTSPAENLAAMKNDGWIPIREQAKHLLASLPKSRFDGERLVD